jgi:predicted lipase
MDSVVQYVLKQKEIDDVIKKAVLSRDKYGNKHSHQWRIYNYVYDKFIQNLLNVEDEIDKVKDFDELYDIIDSNKPSGVGELFCYDTALRIGQRLDRLPEKIYIHAGTRVGLERFLKRKIHEKTIEKQMLPEPFRSCELTPGQLEDFFCIYKDIFLHNGGKSNAKRNTAGKKCG